MWKRRIRDVSESLARGFGEALFPQTCAGCGYPGEWFCDRCVETVLRDPGPGCRRCGRPGRSATRCPRCELILPEPLTELRAGFVLDGPMRQAIHRFKYLRERERGRDLGRRLAACLPEMFTNLSDVDAIVPVPLHPRRQRQRGFNQAAVLADQLSGVMDIPVVSIVQRIRNTPTQTQLDINQRANNVAKAFALNERHRHSVSGKRLLIIDDVTTTGATIGAVATVLANGGAKPLLAVTVAREGVHDYA